MWVEFVVGSLPCSERFFSGYSGFPLSLKTNTFKFQFDLERMDTSPMSSYELLSAPWVNKLQFYNFFFLQFTNKGSRIFQGVSRFLSEIVAYQRARK